MPVYYYGTSDQDDFQAKDIVRTPEGSNFTAYFKGQKLGDFTIHLYGEHSVLNALAVIAVAYLEKVDLQEIQRELATFTGVKRRFSESDVNGKIIIDDYAHHPSEIKATLDAARQKYPNREVVAIFQPHTYSRLQAYLTDFGKSLALADKLYVTPIFGSIRENVGNISSADLEKLVPNSEEIDLDSMTKLLNHDHAVFVFMGAGDIEKYEDQFEALLEK